MTIKEDINMGDALRISLEEFGDNEFWQKSIIDRIYEITNGRYKKDSILGNVFRNVKNYPWFFKNYTKIKRGRNAFWKKQSTEYHQDYKKPIEYFQSLNLLNMSETIYTLCGTESNCLSVLDKDKTIKVDFSPLTKPDIKGDIFKIKKKEGAAFNLDFEGIFSKKKAEDINNLSTDKILLTFKSSKNDVYLDLLKFNKTHIKTYKNRGCVMKIYYLDLSISSKTKSFGKIPPHK